MTTRYTRDHEWIRLDGDVATVGISEYAQDQLGDIVFVELPEVGSAIAQFGSFGVVESVKAVSDLYAPISGEVTEVNAALAEQPELLNSDAYGEGWIARITLTDDAELDALMDADAYTELTS